MRDLRAAASAPQSAGCEHRSAREAGPGYGTGREPRSGEGIYLMPMKVRSTGEAANAAEKNGVDERCGVAAPRTDLDHLCQQAQV